MPPTASGISSILRRPPGRMGPRVARTYPRLAAWRLSWWRKSPRIHSRFWNSSRGVALRLIRLRAISISLFLSFAVPAASAQIYHDPHRKTTVGFFVDLNTPPDVVLKIVQGVAADSVIRGTSMYAKESDLSDAEFAKSSTVLPPAPGSAQTFYKVKTKVLSPAHFPAANDIGTVTVRYTVEATGSQRARLAIDAVFVTDAGRHLYASDGSVETMEYGEIITQIKALEAPKIRHHNPQTTANLGGDTAGLQGELADEQSRLAEAKATEKKLQERVKQLEFN